MSKDNVNPEPPAKPTLRDDEIVSTPAQDRRSVLRLAGAAAAAAVVGEVVTPTEAAAQGYSDSDSGTIAMGSIIRQANHWVAYSTGPHPMCQWLKRAHSWAESHTFSEENAAAATRRVTTGTGWVTNGSRNVTPKRPETTESRPRMRDGAS